MSKEIIDHGFGVIETRETFYTEETIRQKDLQIADLEAKLAQKDKQLEKLKSDNHALISDNAYQEADIFELNSRIEQLQKQLAEKETEIGFLEGTVNSMQEDISYWEQKLAEKEKENEILAAKLEQANEIINNPDTLIFQQQELIDNLQKTIEEKNKEQNQRAIEQLEKVKSAFGLINSKLDKVETIKEYIHYIDHQINELKGKVEE